MRNLGPACEQDLNAVGIFSSYEVIQLGAEAVFIRVLAGRKKLGRPTNVCSANYLYALYGAIHDLDWRDIPESKKAEFKQLAADIRASGQF